MSGQRVGYIRVSSVDQNVERQLAGLTLSQTFTDMASGKDTDRPQLNQMVAYVRAGDTVVVHSMDRLARNLDDLRRLVKGLTAKGVRIEFVKESLTFAVDASPMSNLLLNVMGSFAEFERSLIRERQREGVAIAKAKGVYKGRKPVLTADHVAFVRARVAEGAKKAALARELAVSRATIHRYMKSEPTISVPVKPEPNPTVTMTLVMEVICASRVRRKAFIDAIEAIIERRNQAVTLDRGRRYRLTVKAFNADDLEAQMADLWWEIENHAETQRCEVNGEFRDEHARTWGQGDLRCSPNEYTDWPLADAVSIA